MIGFREIKENFLHLIFPHICSGCGNDVLDAQSELCFRCLDAMPLTYFEKFAHNPVEKMFWGRLPLVNGSAQFYFTKESMIQQLLHQLKYKGAKELGHQLGCIMGEQLKSSGRFDIDALIPLPLFPSKEKKRGYNQATILCNGISETWGVPVWDNIIARPQFTETQTKKGRVERWKNMEGKFVLLRPGDIEGKKLLLVDDVITTGATLEASGATLLQAEGVQLSIASLCIAAR
jgi:ComF family protein